ncbi:bifunctional 2-C-methyl-D-erythritol 4-phosphate cytidylyltransferase/2-C-methyl-D-erythritol 2,4-cyclodiphosphate synthase [Sulfurospirillum diekertiae]|uniref:Bifunctional enzyme IspD/IspF n=1 Tax=Sulfurospirillum diekertiae TaxID=1854492 RepID=A0A6G9VY92_9BACT|nr:bifunctional 2-C-methyl-D-erythritol 4-phosphate cytidylyltransferase/2-C-methyl-D-erythritol 2,4-cyclodiphosphate synthase [Sulfurospirillum diekertiae]QIR77279.1 bifunctional 2-C-methyl-D-erythritol 4-phosphate cytidylyltransferase/2-C-methyl-D-erythritol 2,4-cyclodiphosphate synthase [Sulfurospirillum diekertiae]QIR79894.1 bifunctional 2-C-methyl-D-erythritol 4-phosphate cytidylyltransferase/2-C-methyl-D-erythritol 2,4-cyclodiphosphate synthase [Sulfurospirillum diekertiae]
MPDLALVMLGAGSSSRFNQRVKKQWLRIEDTPLWLFATQNLQQLFPFKQIIVTTTPDEYFYAKKFSESITFVEGGATRQESLANALLHVKTPYVLVSDIARPCVDQEMLVRILAEMENSDIVVPYLPVVDTVVYEDATINRDHVKLIQTPQLSRTELLRKALQTSTLYTDDSSAIKAMGGKVTYVLGNPEAKKLTCKEDGATISCLKAPSSTPFVGEGFDVHAYEDGKVMMLGGVEVHPTTGFKAHSDGDVAIHALIDALLGAAGAGDIGELFPDNDPRYKNIDSKFLLKEVCSFLAKVGFEIIHCDITVMAEFPRLSAFKDKIRFTLANIMAISPIHVNVKATTTEKLGFVGRCEGVAVSATATLKYYDWTNV